MEKSVKLKPGDIKVGDLLMLVDHSPFAGLNYGQTGTVTNLNVIENSFSVNGKDGCGYEYWKLISKGKREKFHR